MATRTSLILRVLAHLLGIGAFLAGLGSAANASPLPVPQFGLITVSGGARLHYMEAGHGPLLIFVHGSLSDYTYWQSQVETFAAKYDVIAYSRRYNFPNNNPAIKGYSAIRDADDLASLIRNLHRGSAFVVGHSYGALTALFLTVRHPELVRAVVLAEPPAMSLLQSEPTASEGGDAMYSDIERKMVAPMRRAFAARRDEEGIDDFLSYVFGKPAAWSHFSVSDKAETLRDAHEWQVMMTSGELFPYISPKSVRAIRTPILMLSGAKSYPFLNKIGAELQVLIPSARRITFPKAGHQMWLTDREACERDTLEFFAEHGGPPSR